MIFQSHAVAEHMGREAAGGRIVGGGNGEKMDLHVRTHAFLHQHHRPRPAADVSRLHAFHEGRANLKTIHCFLADYFCHPSSSSQEFLKVPVARASLPVSGES